jgi:hypothetical protein
MGCLVVAFALAYSQELSEFIYIEARSLYFVMAAGEVSTYCTQRRIQLRSDDAIGDRRHKKLSHDYVYAWFL